MKQSNLDLKYSRSSPIAVTPGRPVDYGYEEIAHCSPSIVREYVVLLQPKPKRILELSRASPPSDAKLTELGVLPVNDEPPEDDSNVCKNRCAIIGHR